MVKDISTRLGGLALDNPVIPASGTFGFGLEMAGVYDLDILGAISIKGTTREARFGNPTPRIAECEGGLINSVGLQNPGIDAVIAEDLPALRKVFHKPIIANISGFSVDEYVECCARMDKEEQVEILEVNVSCPNVHNGGMAFGTSPEAAAEVTRAVKAVTRKPVYVKLSPIYPRFVKPYSFSGRAIFPIALRMVYQVSHACSVPVMGCGGVATASDVIEMMMAGASAVQVGAENLRNPFACKDIIEALPAEMERLHIDRLTDIIGIID